jgi:hypothetical protein
MTNENICQICLVALATGAFFGVGVPVKADQLVSVRTQQLDYFNVKRTCAAWILLG